MEMKIIEVKRPVFESLGHVRENYNAEVNRAKEIVAKENLLTQEGKFALTFLLASANLIASAGPNLSKVVKGGTENPSLEIDLIGGEIADMLLPAFLWEKQGREGTEIYIEERKAWEAHPKGVKPLSGENARMILVDPCDETISPSYRSVGISIFDKEGKFLAGGVAGIDDEIVVFVEGEKVGFVGLDGGKNSLKDPLSVKFAPGAPEHLKIATLTRRLDDEKTWKSLQRISPDGRTIHQTFGGYGLISMLRGELDLMVDSSKGQPWYEAAQWGALAEKLGFSVEYDGGKIPDAQYIISKPTPPRTPLVISRNKEIHLRVLEALRQV